MLQRLVINGPSVNSCHATDCIRDRQPSLAKCLLCSGLLSKNQLAANKNVLELGCCTFRFDRLPK